MKFGVKIWSTNYDLIKKAKFHYLQKDFDYIEISAIIGSFNPNIHKALKGIPVIIHCDVNYNDSLDDVNLSMNANNHANVRSLKEAKLFADYLDSDIIIIHPGHGGSYKNINAILQKYPDKRYCCENMPGKTYDLKYDCLGRNKKELQSINTKTYCLDIAHAIKASRGLSLDPYDCIREFFLLNISIIHLSDGNMMSLIDEHLAIGEGNFDFGKIFSLIKNDFLITLETPKFGLDSFYQDIRNICAIKRFYSLNNNSSKE
jgi:endonuclease IV